MRIRAFVVLILLPLVGLLSGCSRCCDRPCKPRCNPCDPRAGADPDPQTSPDPQPFARFRFYNDDADEDVMPAQPNANPPPPYVDGSKLHMCTFADCSGSFGVGLGGELAEIPFADVHGTPAPFDYPFGSTERFNRRAVWIALKVGAHPVRYSRLYLCDGGATIRDMEVRYYDNGWEDAVVDPDAPDPHPGRYKVRVVVFNRYSMSGGPQVCPNVPFDDYIELEAPPAP